MNIIQFANSRGFQIERIHYVYSVFHFDSQQVTHDVYSPNGNDLIKVSKFGEVTEFYKRFVVHNSKQYEYGSYDLNTNTVIDLYCWRSGVLVKVAPDLSETYTYLHRPPLFKCPKVELVNAALPANSRIINWSYKRYGLVVEFIDLARRS